MTSVIADLSMSQPAGEFSDARAYRASTLTAYSLAVERVLQAMRAHLAQPLSLEAMAEIACLSPFHFNRVFRSITGAPPGEFLAALRLDAAKRMLLTTSLSVTDVCFELGYASLGTFTTRFKQLIGVSPLQLRQLADNFELPTLKPPDDGVARRLAAVHDWEVRGWGFVTGSVTLDGPFAGAIFVGLFSKPIPQERPVACMTLPAPGRYQLGPVPDGRYYLFGAALPWSQSALAYLTPGVGLLVGAAEQPTLVRGGRAVAIDLALRPLAVADPPILGVFPPLLATPAALGVRA